MGVDRRLTGVTEGSVIVKAVHSFLYVYSKDD